MIVSTSQLNEIGTTCSNFKLAAMVPFIIPAIEGAGYWYFSGFEELWEQETRSWAEAEVATARAAAKT